MSCPICGVVEASAVLEEARWVGPETARRLGREHPGWVAADGACPACVQEALLEELLAKGDEALHLGIQRAWPIDAEAAYGALPMPLRMHANPHYTGRGVTLALVDAGFYPHPDLAAPRNRIVAWVDATQSPPVTIEYSGADSPRWPGWDRPRPSQWHGLMTSVTAAGNGWGSHGFYRGLAPDASLILVQVGDGQGRIDNASILRALIWLRSADVDVVNVSVGADPVSPLAGNAIDAAVAALAGRGVTVVAAAGNDGVRRLAPPATSPEAVSVGGLDDRGLFSHEELAVWHSNYGTGSNGCPKPELVAPSLWVVAPVLPTSAEAREAGGLFAARARGETWPNAAIAERKLVRPDYQLVEGTSFAAPIVAATACCMLEANRTLTPADLRVLMQAAASSIPGATTERQGAGALDTGQAVALALYARGGLLHGTAASARVRDGRARFVATPRSARRLRVLGSWDGWRGAGAEAMLTDGAVWVADMPAPPPGRYEYKFLIDDHVWCRDYLNPLSVPDGHSGFNSVLVVPAQEF